MSEVLEAAFELQAFCASRNWQYCFIGGLAVQRWGEPRNTQDADLTLLTGFGTEEPYIDGLLSGFSPRRPDMREFALQNRVALLKASNGIPLDVALGAMPFEENSVKRSSLWMVRGDSGLRTCSAEDLMVHKTFAGRDRDWLDLEGILLSQGSRLDLELVRSELVPLLALKEDAEAMARLTRLAGKCGVSFP